MSLTTTSREERLRARDSARQAAAAAQLQAAEAAKALADAERECPVDVPPAIEAAKLTALVQSVGRRLRLKTVWRLRRGGACCRGALSLCNTPSFGRHWLLRQAMQTS